MSVDQLCINTIRMLSVDGVQKANSGHPGLPMGAAAMAYTLWSRHLKHNPSNPNWPDRDRFVLSGGHGSMLIYSLLHLYGYPLSLDELKSFRQWGSRTPGHPEYRHTAGVECTTGPLGQGFSTAVGMAIAEAHLAARYNTDAHRVVDHFTYVLASDGDLMEGVSSEAASLAGHLGLGKLICLYDSNNISLAGAAALSFSEDVNARFAAMGWHVQTVEDGNDVAALDAAISAAKAEADRPSIITVKTIIGFGSPNKAGTAESHGSPLGPDEVAATKANLGWPAEPAFYIPEAAAAEFAKSTTAGAAAEAEWTQAFDAWCMANPSLAKEWADGFSGALPAGWDREVPVFAVEESSATRASGGKVLNAIARNYPALIGGSADLNPSTNTALKGMGDFQKPPAPAEDVEGAVGGGWSYAGRNIHFGVREHGMAAAANGIALHGGLRPFVATFFNFVDYLKPALRLSALMELPVIYVFTHDSIGLGEDGPTHQPIEQLASLRAVPHVTVIRPSDANETAEAWKAAVQRTTGPTVLILSRQKAQNADRSLCGSAEGLHRGAYILKDAAGGSPQVVLIGTGTEVSIALSAQEILGGQGISARVVSMPSWELFDAQTEEYRNSVLPKGVPAVSIEAAATTGWHKYACDPIGVDHFGASAPAEKLYQEFGLTAEKMAERARALLR